MHPGEIIVGVNIQEIIFQSDKGFPEGYLIRDGEEHDGCHIGSI